VTDLACSLRKKFFHEADIAYNKIPKSAVITELKEEDEQGW